MSLLLTELEADLAQVLVLARIRVRGLDVGPDVGIAVDAAVRQEAVLDLVHVEDGNVARVNRTLEQPVRHEVHAPEGRDVVRDVEAVRGLSVAGLESANGELVEDGRGESRSERNLVARAVAEPG